MNCLSNISSIDQNVKELLYYNFEALKKKKKIPKVNDYSP